jgi:hypothetical protein
MSYSEFNSWVQFFKRWPFDDFHRFHRPASLIAASMAGQDIEKLQDYLQPPITPAVPDDLQAWGAFLGVPPEQI